MLDFHQTQAETKRFLSSVRYSQTCAKRPYKTRYILVFQTDGCLLLNESSAESLRMFHTLPVDKTYFRLPSLTGVFEIEKSYILGKYKTLVQLVSY